MWWGEGGIPGLPRMGSDSWQTFLQTRKEMISSFPPVASPHTTWRAPGGKSSSVLLPTGSVFHVWPLSSSPALDTALKTGTARGWAVCTAQPAREVCKRWEIGRLSYQHCRQCFFPGAWRAGLGLVTSHLPQIPLGCWVVTAAKCQKLHPNSSSSANKISEIGLL